MKRAVLWILATTLLLAIVLLGQHQRVAEPRQDPLESRGFFELDAPQPLEETRLIDPAGQPVRLDTLSDDWTLVFFGFTACPDVCPTTLSILNLALQDEPDPPAVVMVTVDPERDTPARLQQYVSSFNPDFRGFSGSIDDIRELTDQLHIQFAHVPIEGQPDNYTVEHSGALVVLDPDGRHAGYIRPPLKVEDVRTIARALAHRTSRGASD